MLYFTFEQWMTLMASVGVFGIVIGLCFAALGAHSRRQTRGYRRAVEEAERIAARSRAGG